MAAAELAPLVEAIERREDLSVHAVPPGGAWRAGTTAGASRRRRVRARVLDSGLGEALAVARRQVAARRNAREVLDTAQPTVVLATDDRVLGLELAVLHEARHRRIPVVLLQVAASSPTADALVRRQRKRHRSSGPLGRLVARALPQQRRRQDPEDLLFFPPLVTLVLLALRQLPCRPWQLGASSADVVATFEQESLQGLPARVVLTGQPSLDAMAATRRSSPGRRGGGRPLVCCALPHLGEHALLPWEMHVAEIEWLVEVLGGRAADVVVSVHPRADPARYGALVRTVGARLATEPLRDILPVSDVFLATASSSTVRWAALLGVATVVLDHHDLGGDDFDGLLRSRGRDDLAPLLDGLLSDAEHRLALGTRLQRSAHRRYGALDGGATERVLALLREHALPTSGEGAP